MQFDPSASTPTQEDARLSTAAESTLRQGIWRTLFFLFLLALNVYCIKNALWNIRHQDGWSMGDWLINYHGGFIRRGLTGAFLLGACRLLRLNVFWTLAAVQLGLYITLGVAVWRLVRSSQWPQWMLFALFSPATLLFPVREFPEAYRKEELLLVGLAWLLLALQRREMLRWLSPVLAVFAGACVLSHEGLICYFPYGVAALYAGFRSVRRTLTVAALPLATSLVCFAFSAAHPGNAHLADEVCRGVGFKQLNPLPSACDGAISYLAYDKQHARQMVSSLALQRHYFRIYPVVALLAALPLLAGGFSLWRAPAERRSLLGIAAAFLISAVGSIPLFVYAFDWNRWIYIHAFCLTLLLLFLTDRQPTLDVPRTSTRFRTVGLALALVLYAGAWRDSYRQSLHTSRFKKVARYLHLQHSIPNRTPV